MSKRTKGNRGQGLVEVVVAIVLLLALVGLFLANRGKSPASTPDAADTPTMSHEESPAEPFAEE